MRMVKPIGSGDGVMTVIQFAGDGSLSSSGPGTPVRAPSVARADEILSLRQNASELLRRLRYVRETWLESDTPPALERWVLQQVLHCLAASRNPPSGDQFDRIAAAGEALELLMELPGADFGIDEAAAAEDGYDLVDFDADLDDAEDLAGKPD